MTDSPERVIVNFGDIDLSDVCLVMGNTEFNVHKMKDENRFTIEAGQVEFQRMLELLYEGCCTNETNCPKCGPVLFELRELIKRYTVKIQWTGSQYQSNFYKTFTNQNSDSPRRVICNFGDAELSDVCLVMGNTDFNVHRMENDKRFALEADPKLFQRILEILYDGYCFSEKFFRCRMDFPEVFWKKGVPLLKLLDYYDVKVGLKYFEERLNKFCCPENSIIYPRLGANTHDSLVSACYSCVLRKVFAMQHGIKLKVSAFYSRAVQAAVKLAHEKNIEIDNEVLTELIVSYMHHGAK